MEEETLRLLGRQSSGGQGAGTPFKQTELLEGLVVPLSYMA